MSVRATNWAWEKGRELQLNNGELLLLVRVGDHADHDGLCFPGTKHLAEFCVCDERTVRRNLSRLEEHGLLHRERRPAKHGRGRSHDSIQLHLGAADQAGILSGRSESTNRTPASEPTGHSDPLQPDTGVRPYIEEPSGTVNEPPPQPPQRGGRLDPPSNGRRRDHDRYAEDLVAFHESLKITPAAEKAWAAALKKLSKDLPASTRGLYIDPLELVGDLDGELYLTAPLPVVAWIERKYRDQLQRAVGEDYGVVVIPQAERAAA